MAVAAVVAVAAIDLRGVHKTSARPRRCSPSCSRCSASPWSALVGGTADAGRPAETDRAGARGVLQPAGLLFFALAREGDLPRPLAAVSARTRVPHVAETVVAAAVVGLVLVLDVREAIGFSSVAVLVYYAVANAAALTLRGPERRYPPAVPVVGLVGCLAATVPVASVVGGCAVLAVCVAARAAVIGRRRP